MISKKFSSVDEYIAEFPPQIKKVLGEIRKIIRDTAPETTEVISYNMPAYRQFGVIVYFAANKNHLGFYPTGSPIRVFKDQLSDYKTSKGAIQFPLSQPLPEKLIIDIVRFRLVEDKERAEQKKAK